MKTDTKLLKQYELDASSLETLGLTDAEPPAAFDSLTRLAKRLFRVPVALISIVEEEKDRQFFLSQQGLSDPWASCRQTPLSHSFCQHVKRERKPLVVKDARHHPLVKDNLAITELGAIAYLGVPILMPDGTPLGALCVIESAVRKWTNEDLAALTDLACCVNDEILLRATLIYNQQSHERSLRYNAMRESIALAFMAPDLSLESRFLQLLRASCEALGVSSGRIIKIDCGLTESLFVHDPGRQFATHASQMNLEVLTRMVASECSHVCFQDLSQPCSQLQFHKPENVKGCYARTPLIFNGTLYGAIEFVCDRPRISPWSGEELSILSIVSMFATAHLGVFGQIAMLQNSEAALLLELAGAGKPI